VPHRVAAADVEQAWLQAGLDHQVEEATRFLERDAPVLRVAALRADVEGDARKVDAQLGRGGDDLARVAGAGAELARKRPVAADVGGGDAQVLLRVGLDLENAAHFLRAVDHVPLDALGGGAGDRLPGFHRVGVEDLGGVHPERQEQVELAGRGDLEAAALLGEHLEHAPVRIGLDRVVRTHARHSGAKAPRLGTDDGRVEDQERSDVFLLGSLAGDLEVELDLGMRIEELFLRLPGDCGASAADAARAVPHQSSPRAGN